MTRKHLLYQYRLGGAGIENHVLFCKSGIVLGISFLEWLFVKHHKTRFNSVGGTIPHVNHVPLFCKYYVKL